MHNNNNNNAHQRIHYVENLIEAERWNEVKKFFAALHASEAAELLRELEEDHYVKIYRLLPRKFASKMFSYLTADDQNFLVSHLNNKEITDLLAVIKPDDRVAFFEALTPEVRESFLKLLSAEDLKEVTHLLSYPRESVGRVMTSEYIAIPLEWTAKKAIAHIRKRGREQETLEVVYCVDDNCRLMRELRLSDLIFVDPSTPVSEIPAKPLVTVSVFDDRETAVHAIKKYNRTVLPVVDSHHVLMGIVTIDDLMDVQEEEVTEDFHKLGGVSSHKGDSIVMGNLLDTSLTFLYKRRIVWLLLLIFVNIFSGAAIASFEDVISRSIALVFFLPLLIDSGGNAGSQAATLMVRSLATGDVKIMDWFTMLRKELIVSMLIGLTMGSAVAVLGVIRGGPEIAMVVTLSMMVIVVVGSLVGMSLPFLFTKFNRDPATASGPLVTSIADIFGVLIYFSIASMVLGS